MAAIFTAALISLVPLLIDGPHIYSEWLRLTREFHGYTWTSNASMVSLGDRLHLAPAGQIAAVALALTVLICARRWRPAPLDATALGLMTVILVGPVSWAGYTLLLLPYLFSVRWDGWTWVSIGLFVIPFAPGRAFASVGVNLVSLVDVPARVVGVLVPGTLVPVAGTVVMPLAGAVYGWATLLLLYRLCLRLTERQSRPLLGRFQPHLRELRLSGTLPEQGAPSTNRPEGAAAGVPALLDD